MEGWLVALSVVLILFLLVLPSIYHWCRSLYEVKRYLALSAIKKKHSDIHFVQTRRGRLVYRYTKAHTLEDNEESESDSLISESDNFGEKKVYPYPIVLPGGLGSSLTNTSFIHAKLVKLGFDVLSYDRLGVGLSSWPKKSENNDGLTSMQETIEEMDTVMSDANPDAKGWIIIGGSYGSAVGQLYTSQYPEKVVAFINWDGLPYYLSKIPKSRKSFGAVAAIYAVEAFFSDLGFLRFPIWLMTTVLGLSKSYKNSGFSWDEVYAEFQDSKLLRTIQKETPAMMDCCDLLVEAWGDINFDHLSKDLFNELVDCPADVTVNHKGTEEIPRKISNEEKQTKEDLKNRLRNLDTTSKLAQRWREIPVVSISCRNYDYDKMELFMTKQNKDLYAAEHVFLSLMSRDGLRIVFPDKSHAGSVSLGDYLAKYAIHLAELASDIERGLV